MEVEKDGWYYLDANGQAQGPFSIAMLGELNAQGYFNDVAMFWRDGQADWQPLSALTDLQSAMQQASAEAGGMQSLLMDDEQGGAVPAQVSADSMVAGAGEGAEPGQAHDGQPLDEQNPGYSAAVDQSQAASRHADHIHSAPAIIKPPDPEGEDDVLALFRAEISALEGDEVAEGPATPPPEEQTFVDDDGTWYKLDPMQRKFVEGGMDMEAGALPDYDENLMTFQADVEVIPEYKPPRPPGDSDSEEEGKKPPRRNAEHKRKTEEALEREKERAKKAKENKAEQAEQQAGWFELKNNTSVYVTGLPEDVTDAELVEVFSKCGLIKEDEQRRPKIKIYRDKQTGLPKGDGLVTYLKTPSVELALQILDGGTFRPDMSKPMTVTKAEFQQKGEAYVPKVKQKNKKKNKKGDADERRLGWGGFDDKPKTTKVMVILKHMFTVSELAEDPFLRDELERDVLSECGKMAPVEKVRVFHSNPEGVVSVKFRTEEGAAACIRVMEGRFFAGRQIGAQLWDGVTNYAAVKVKETAEEEQARLDRFAAELEGK